MKQTKFTVTFFTDLHHADEEHGDFNCRKALPKLKEILAKTEESDCYVSLGDLVDVLREDSAALFEEAVAFLRDHGVPSYGGGDPCGREVYHVMGNHETAFLAKGKLAAYIPYREGVGSVYTFRRGGVLFAVLDGNYDRATGKDACGVMRASTSFTFPPAEIQWVKEELARGVEGDVKSIVWLCHVAYRDLDECARQSMARAFLSFGLPVYIFEGHTHTERFYTVAAEGWEIPVFTLAPVTFDFTVPKEERGESCFFYTAVFEEGRLLGVEKHGRGS